MGRNWYDALCTKCRLPIRMLTGDLQLCGECLDDESLKKNNPKPE